ncbi:MAG: hypothetical protein LBU13_06090 [Synergistaceae bacterium]|jgi:hypothetical protein|nr:hypothetical protein [Synergistaceae bacterium]
MKNIFCRIAFLMLALVVVLSIAGLTAYANGEVGIVPDNPWYLGIDSITGELTNQPFFGQNTVQSYVVSGDECVLILHPEFYPESDEPRTALVQSAIEKILVWNGSSYVPCLDGTMAVVSSDDIQTTHPAEQKYLRFDVLFLMMDARTGEILTDIRWPNAYFKIPEILGEIGAPAVSDEEFVGGLGGWSN